MTFEIFLLAQVQVLPLLGTQQMIFLVRDSVVFKILQVSQDNIFLSIIIFVSVRRAEIYISMFT